MFAKVSSATCTQASEALWVAPLSLAPDTVGAGREPFSGLAGLPLDMLVFG